MVRGCADCNQGLSDLTNREKYAIIIVAQPVAQGDGEEEVIGEIQPPNLNGNKKSATILRRLK
ncbi:TPA: hypothetical protein DD712_02470 [Candidatus Acetothermia bacterium]|nr:hypothetical protein [Candidatus Acetothermia bacterium]